MAYQNISASISAADKATILNSINAIKNLLPFLINLNNEERKRLRKMGPARLAYVQAVQAASIANPQALPGGFSLPEFNKDAALSKDLTDIYVQLAGLFEAIDDTLKAVGAEALREADQAYGHLKVEAKKSGSLPVTNVVNNIAKMLKQGSRGDTPPPAKV